jgi:hypothetical protein
VTLDFCEPTVQNAHMTRISIFRESDVPGSKGFRAIAGEHQSTGKTPGEALDAITGQLDESETGTMCVIQQFKPDRFFTAEQISRLRHLMDAWREARDTGRTFPADDQAELEALVEAELEGSARRAAAMLGKSIP